MRYKETIGKEIDKYKRINVDLHSTIYQLQEIERIFDSKLKELQKAYSIAEYKPVRRRRDKRGN